MAARRSHSTVVRKIQEVQNWFERADFVVYDGGTGTEVERLGGTDILSDDAWTCSVNLTHPHLVKEVHMRYLEAGADIIIANTYATNPNVMKAAGYSDDVITRSTLEACRAARLAVEEYLETHEVAMNVDGSPRPPLVAGSLSCHPPGMARGAELATGTWPSPDEETANLAAHARRLAEGGVDVIFLEMIWDLPHAHAAAYAAASVGLPVFAAVTVPLPMTGDLTDEAMRVVASPSEELRIGGTGCIAISDAVRELTIYSNVIGVNIQHTPLPFVMSCLESVRHAGFDGILGAYPDHGRFCNPHWEFADIDPDDFVRLAEEWVVEHGVKAVGGCCGIGPDVIRRLAHHRNVLAKRREGYLKRKAMEQDMRQKSLNASPPPTFDNLTLNLNLTRRGHSLDVPSGAFVLDAPSPQESYTSGHGGGDSVRQRSVPGHGWGDEDNAPPAFPAMPADSAKHALLPPQHPRARGGTTAQITKVLLLVLSGVLLWGFLPVLSRRGTLRDVNSAFARRAAGSGGGDDSGGDAAGGVVDDGAALEGKPRRGGGKRRGGDGGGAAGRGGVGGKAPAAPPWAVDCGAPWAAEWFKMIDADGDGVVGADEMREFLIPRQGILLRLRRYIQGGPGYMQEAGAARRRAEVPGSGRGADTLGAGDDRVDLAGFTSTWRGYYVGTKQDPCPKPRPVGRGWKRPSGGEGRGNQSESGNGGVGSNSNNRRAGGGRGAGNGGKNPQPSDEAGGRDPPPAGGGESRRGGQAGNDKGKGKIGDNANPNANNVDAGGPTKAGNSRTGDGGAPRTDVGKGDGRSAQIDGDGDAMGGRGEVRPRGQGKKKDKGEENENENKKVKEEKGKGKEKKTNNRKDAQAPSTSRDGGRRGRGGGPDGAGGTKLGGAADLTSTEGPHAGTNPGAAGGKGQRRADPRGRNQDGASEGMAKQPSKRDGGGGGREGKPGNGRGRDGRQGGGGGRSADAPPRG